MRTLTILLFLCTQAFAEPISITTDQHLNFGLFAIQGSSGWIRVNPNGNIRTRNAIDMGGHTNGLVTINGDKKTNFDMQLLPETLSLTNGSNTLTLDRLRSTGRNSLNNKGTRTIKIGATLRFNGNESGGVYTAQQPLSVIVNYN